MLKVNRAPLNGASVDRIFVIERYWSRLFWGDQGRAAKRNLDAHIIYIYISCH